MTIRIHLAPSRRRRYEPDENWEEPGDHPALPAHCLRAVTGFNEGKCHVACEGRQADGSCLADYVRACNAGGRPWRFDMDKDGNWLIAQE